jgi:leucine-rich PPR motif-containing protein
MTFNPLDQIKHHSEKEEQDNTDTPQMIRVGMEFRIADVSEKFEKFSIHLGYFIAKLEF